MYVARIKNGNKISVLKWDTLDQIGTRAMAISPITTRSESLHELNIYISSQFP
jgi:hypothetical protein